MSTVYIVHCIDTEGPLAEQAPSVLAAPVVDKATRYDFEREDLASVIERHRPNVLGSWEQVLAMLRRATAREERHRLPDSAGNGWVFNWFCMDHVGFTDNPRQRAMGMHSVFDVYREMVESQQAGDALHWHFHPMSTYGEAHRCATSYLNSPMLREIVARRILDRGWFPRANRAGFQDERPDSHWFLEQWVPFDLSNTAKRETGAGETPPEWWDSGRFSDWRWAPDDWRTYHPDHDHHQKEGGCRRKIARCLNVLNRFANLDQPEMEKAFARAEAGQPTLVAFASHDWRDLVPEMDYVRHLLSKVAPRHPDVDFRYAEAVKAFNAVHAPADGSALQLDCRLQLDDEGLPRRVTVKPRRGRIFGPQPFLALRSRSNRIIHDNMNYGDSLEDHAYEFDAESLLPDDVRGIGIAANDSAGNQSIHVIDIDEARRLHQARGEAEIPF